MSFKNTIKTTMALGAALGVFMAGQALAAERVLKVTNWAEYIAEDTISNFEKETGIKVIYDTYESAESIDAKLLAGSSGYDVVSHAGSFVARLIMAGGILQKLDASKLDNVKHMDPAIMEQLGKDWDPGNSHFVPFMWGSHGMTYNKELVLETNPNAPLNLDLIFNPDEIAKVAKCGISMLDSPTDIIPMAMAYMGLDPNSTNPADYKKVGAMLAKIRPHIKTFDNYAYQRMPQKEFCIATTWGPDGLLAMSGAEEANTGVVLDFYLPEGQNAANLWIDGWVVPADAENVEEAHMFLNYMMRPEVGAADSNYTWYATANMTAKPMIDEAVTSSPAAFPTPAQVSLMYTGKVLPPKIKRLQTRTWTDFKAGK